MRLSDYLRSVRHTFSANRARAALTLLGIIIGAGSIVLLAGLLAGGEEALLARSQQANEADLVQVRRDDPPPEQFDRTRRELSRTDAETLQGTRSLEGARVASENSKDGRAQFHGKEKRLRFVSATPVVRSLYRLEIDKGRFLTEDDLADLRRVCVIGHEIWTDLLDSMSDPIGQQIVVHNEPWTVIGVLANKPMIGGGDGVWMWNRKVLVPETTFDALFSPQGDANRIFVRLDGQGALAERIRTVEGVVRGTLLRRHFGVSNFKIEGAESNSNKERIILTIIKMLLLGTGLLSLFVGGINIMNIMLVTVTERTREIGVRRAIGAPPNAILFQFLLEAALIALAGGVVGVIGGVSLTWLATFALQKTLGAWTMHIEMWSIVTGLLLSVSTGIAFGLFPAWRASKLDPVEALRYE